jgi:hypothetical protein
VRKKGAGVLLIDGRRIVHVCVMHADGYDSAPGGHRVVGTLTGRASHDPDRQAPPAFAIGHSIGPSPALATPQVRIATSAPTGG